MLKKRVVASRPIVATRKLRRESFHCHFVRLVHRNGLVRFRKVSTEFVYSVRIGPPQPKNLSFSISANPATIRIDNSELRNLQTL
jgi:hypothetical protein